MTGQPDTVRAWRSMPTARRTALRDWQPVDQVLPHEARVAIAYGRWAIRSGAVAVVAALVLAGIGWAFTADGGVSLGLGIVAAGALLLALAVALAAHGYRLLNRNIASAGRDMLIAPTTPMILHWRFRFVARLAGTAAVLLAVALLEVIVWRQHSLFGIVITIWTIRLAADNPWPIGSTYPYIGSIGPSGLTVEPLHLVLPWSAITTVEVRPGRIQWFLHNPGAIVAAAPLSPRQKRNLIRRLNFRKGSISVASWCLREPVEDVYRASVRYHSARPAWR